MAIGDAYATPAEYKDQKEKTSPDDDLAIARELLAVSRMIDRSLGRPAGFNKDAAPVARVFVPQKNSPVLRVDDLASIPVSTGEIAIDTDSAGTYVTELVTADYELLPLNAATGPEARPYRQIGLLSWRDRTQWAAGQRVRVTAIWGWPAVPSAIVAATIELTGILRMESPRATNRVNEIGQVLSTSRSAQNILGDLLDTYRALPVFA